MGKLLISERHGDHYIIATPVMCENNHNERATFDGFGHLFCSECRQRYFLSFTTDKQLELFG